MLRFCFGASGAGKSTSIYQEIIKRSFEEPDTDFLIIVPDQFTMQTQKDVVKMHPSRAIMNIDVLSFGRLSHRIFEEVGLSSFCVIDDVGKSLILRRVADMLGDRLPVLGSNMHKPGYIDEVKSIISEFMMYGISDSDLAVLEEKSCGKRALNSKIKDLRTLYAEFLHYIQDKYITTEETLDILCKALPKSNLVKDAVIVFDGFTGFTPIQYKVIGQLLLRAKEVMVTLVISPDKDPYDPMLEEQELFFLTKKTVRDLEKIEGQYLNIRGVRDRSVDIVIDYSPVKRLESNPPLAFLEENLFRYGSRQYADDPSTIEIYAASTPAVEVRQTMIKITEAVRGGGYAYRDIAIVCGALDSYSNLIDRTADKFGIPVYIDQNTSLLLNPFIEYITSAINVALSNYRYEDVFHYMRSGLTDFSREDADILENYVLAAGIRGQKQWDDRFTRHMPRRFKPRKSGNDDLESKIALMERLEGMRKSISDGLKPLFKVKKASAKEITLALYEVIENGHCKEKLEAFRDRFKESGNLKKAREYDQIYDKIITLLSQIMDLIGDDELELSEYRDILNAGFGEIEVGTIPQDADRIIVGDIERTRLKEIKLLFFLGVNDGAIPANAGGGGILSDIDRQFLTELDTGFELAPTPRQQMYIQRLYLYMNLTKPTDKLFLSYSQMGSDGKSLRPAYLIPKLTQMFPELNLTHPENGDFESQNVSVRDSFETAAELLREFAQGHLDEDSEKQFASLYHVLESRGEYGKGLEKLTNAAFAHYENKPLAKALARTLYGTNLEMSVSRLELFASCCYAHFLKYGMRLEERDEYEFDVSDLGNVFHDVLRKYTATIMAKKLDWRELSEKESEEILSKSLIECTDGYKDTILHSSARNQHIIDRLHRILSRTVDTLKYQISKGSFDPAFLEMDFKEAGNLDEISIALDDDEKEHIRERINLRGRIDRVDLSEDSDHVYVKVIDFKSGRKKFSIASLYYGLQLQLVLYMDVAMAVEKKISKGKDVVPAAILYYHIDDPLAEGKNDIQPDDIDKAIRNELKMTGMVSDNTEIIRMMDKDVGTRSDVIPVGIKKDGSLSSASSVFSDQGYEALREYTSGLIRDYGRRILDGEIQVNPFKDDKKDSCKYCAYKTICGYDERIAGFEKRSMELDDKAAMEAIMASVKETDRSEEK